MLLCMVVNVETVINVNRDLLLIVHVLAHFIKRTRRGRQSTLVPSFGRKFVRLEVDACN